MRRILDVPWYVANAPIQKDLETETVKKEIERYSEHYEERLRTHHKELATFTRTRKKIIREELPNSSETEDMSKIR